MAKIKTTVGAFAQYMEDSIFRALDGDHPEVMDKMVKISFNGVMCEIPVVADFHEALMQALDFIASDMID